MGVVGKTAFFFFFGDGSSLEISNTSSSSLSLLLCFPFPFAVFTSMAIIFFFFSIGSRRGCVGGGGESGLLSRSLDCDLLLSAATFEVTSPATLEEDSALKLSPIDVLTTVLR